MLRRLASGAALVAAAAMVLVGCTPPEPTETDEQLLVYASDSFNGFYGVVDDQFSAGQASPGAFEQYATPEMSARWANDIQAALNAGTMSHGVLELTNIELRDRTQNTVRVALCTDGNGVRSTDSEGNTIAPSGLVAWDAEFVSASDGTRLLIDDLQPSEDQSVCNS